MIDIALLMDLETFCTTSAKIWQVLGYIIMIFKIVIPILLLVFGTIDLGKAVVSNDEKAIKTATKSWAFRAAAAALIFLLPAIVKMVMTWIFDLSGTDLDYKTCLDCVTNPGACKESR